MQQGKVGDLVIVESEHVGHPGREGQVVEVLTTGGEPHYRVRWEDGRESIFYPSLGSVTFRTPASRR